MPVALSAAVNTASELGALSKAVWRSSLALSRLEWHFHFVDIAVKDLTTEVELLGHEFDLLHANLNDAIGKSETIERAFFDIGDATWKCILAQVMEMRMLLQDVETFIKRLEGENTALQSQAQRQSGFGESRLQIPSLRNTVHRQTKHLRILSQLIQIVFACLQPSLIEKDAARILNDLRNAATNIHESAETSSKLPCFATDAMIMQAVQEAITRDAMVYRRQSNQQVIEISRGTDDNTRVVQDQADGQLYSPTGQLNHGLSISYEDRRRQRKNDIRSTQAALEASQSESLKLGHADKNDSEDDLQADIAKAALETGTTFFDAQIWIEAEPLLREAQRALQQLSPRQRALWDTFSLQHKLAICSYHTQDPVRAEKILTKLAQCTPNSDEQRRYVCDAVYLLSLLHVRMGQVDLALSKCEQALQGQRKLLGKESNAALESTALLSHIYVMLDNRPRAKSCLAMIPEARRGDILKKIEDSLGTKVDHLGTPPLVTRPSSEAPNFSAQRIHDNPITSFPILLKTNNHFEAPNLMVPAEPPASGRWHSHQSTRSDNASVDNSRSTVTTPLSSIDGRYGNQSMSITMQYNNPETSSAKALSLNHSPPVSEDFAGRAMSRKEILDKMKCIPRDRLEEAVCNSDQATFTSLLDKKAGFLRSKLRKHVRSERVTALHFAALFGEIDMAKRLIASNFNVNEAPFGYSTNLTPLHFAVGARQQDMVELLIFNGARLSESESWSALAGQLMNRSWLTRTASEVDKEQVPKRMIAIFRILLKQGWDINAPIDTTSRTTVLHQAVSFWTGSYRWDLFVRNNLTSFLCGEGADPHRLNSEGKSPHDLAYDAGHQDILLILDQSTRRRKLSQLPIEPVELPAEPKNTIWAR